MTDSEWRTSTDADAMLAHLGDRASPRKLRLFACACCRQVWPLLDDTRRIGQTAVLTAERYADGLANFRELTETAQRVAAVKRVVSDTGSPGQALLAASNTLAEPMTRAAAAITAAAARRARPGWTTQPELLRDVFGVPFRPVWVDPEWLRHADGTVAAIARRVYDEHRFADLPVLADALMEAGCADEELLAHCRAGGPHARGCWVVDALLGRSS